MWGIQLPPRDRPLAWISALVGPLLGLGGKLTPRSSLDHELTAGNFPTNTLTHDAEMWDFMKTQIETETDLALGGPTLQWLRGALLETTRLARMTPPAIPTLTLLGTEEAIVHPDPIRAMMAKWPGGTLEMVPGARHELMMELPEIRNHFYARATELFLRHAEA
jgi:lysophospholipase